MRQGTPCRIPIRMVCAPRKASGKNRSREDCEGRDGDGVEKRHDRCEVASELNNYVTALASNPGRFADPDNFPIEFDWKYGDTGDDLFQVGNQWLRADEFGNFAAGYAGQRAWQGFGHIAMVIGGIAVASQSDSEEHWFDGASRPMINAGAARARLEQTSDGGMSYSRDYGGRRRAYVEPLTSRRGCQ